MRLVSNLGLLPNPTMPLLPGHYCSEHKSVLLVAFEAPGRTHNDVTVPQTAGRS